MPATMRKHSLDIADTPSKRRRTDRKEDFGIMFEAKPSTTVSRLLELWAQHLERRDDDVAVDPTRLQLTDKWGPLNNDSTVQLLSDQFADAPGSTIAFTVSRIPSRPAQTLPPSRVITSSLSTDQKVSKLYEAVQKRYSLGEMEHGISDQGTSTINGTKVTGHDTYAKVTHTPSPPADVTIIYCSHFINHLDQHEHRRHQALSAEPMGRKFGYRDGCLQVELKGSHDAMLTFDAKPHTTVGALREFWAQHLEWRDSNIAIDVSRLQICLFNGEPLDPSEFVCYLPQLKKQGFTGDRTQRTVRLTVSRLPLRRPEDHGAQTFVPEITESSSRFTLYMKTLGGGTHTLRVSRSMTVLHLKQQVERLQGVSADSQRYSRRLLVQWLTGKAHLCRQADGRYAIAELLLPREFRPFYDAYGPEGSRLLTRRRKPSDAV
ncbi:hypothetical protein A1Q2_06807 [Trichosporon asahii var. asahii CBS 8904]|uniref:Ubiquitin-like domain-containing protein n=1 Tax=Trichosporon asahii var. asahii (strain CBS 8904) TaxID=1220162 RepID=K1VI70_TRIAC|nr:hypothetical protein A1Q2_06807 [Trichosporon asahii var. asahii CBS 8904]